MRLKKNNIIILSYGWLKCKNDGKIEKGESGWKIQGTVTVIEDIAGPVPIPEKHEENQTVNEFN